jgi:predicted metalloprotease with PDZ domain
MMVVGRTVALVLLLAGTAHAGITYELGYRLDQSDTVAVTVTPDRPVKAPIEFIVPRTYPGGYAEIPYDHYVEGLAAVGADGQPLKIKRDADGPRYRLGESGQSLGSIQYRVAVARMEKDTVDAVSSSKLRPGYAGILGYSVFGYLEGFEAEPARLKVSAPPNWPVLLTLNPRVPLRLGTAEGESPDFYELADSQVLMGSKLMTQRLDGKIPLFIAVYAEAPVSFELEAKLAREALDCVQDYFGDVPMAAYTVGMEFLQPLDQHHEYGFSQEHVASGSFTLPAEAALTERSDPRELRRTGSNFAHHMAHSWIPKRAYGEGYRPFNWEMEPVIDTIWFNEGFGRYAAIQAMALGMPAEEGKSFRDAQLASLRAIIDSAPPFIRRMRLEVLSREASFLYSSDFRTGRNIFARGALMAAEMDDRIQKQTKGAKSLREALRWLLKWSESNHRPFATADLPRYFATATGVDVADILERWQEPLEHP